MATVRVAYKRTFQDMPFWSQVVELSIEGASVDEVAKQSTSENLRRMAKVYQDMETVGDDLVGHALAKPDPRDAQKPDSPRPGRPR